MHAFVDLISWVLLSAGGFFCVTGGLGLLRLPDYFSRVHGAGVLDGLGLGLVMAGLMLQAGLSLITIKLLLILIFLVLTGPTASHALARAALYGGVKPQLTPPKNPEERL